jgi:hypothetical protein
MIRHVLSCVAEAILLLPGTVVQAAFLTLLIPAVGDTMLLEACYGTATRAAIALAAITTPANPEHRLAPIAAALTLPENRLARNGHVLLQKGLDNGSPIMAG